MYLYLQKQFRKNSNNIYFSLRFFFTLNKLVYFFNTCCLLDKNFYNDFVFNFRNKLDRLSSIYNKHKLLNYCL